MKPLTLTFHGAAGEVTGSMHVIERDGRAIVLDAGMFQGRRAETRGKNLELKLEVGRIEALILSHAHIDHAGRLPLLTKLGYGGPIHCTPATRDLATIMLADAAHIQVKDAEHLRRHGKYGPESEPLYDMEDALKVPKLMRTIPYDTLGNAAADVTFRFLDAGHILGSASVDVTIDRGAARHRLVFSGDIGRSGLPVIRDPQPPRGAIDTLIIESTYGDKLHDSVSDAEARLAAIVDRVATRGGKLLIPSFAVGRAQELVYSLHDLHRRGQIPPLPIYVDSPLAVDATAVFRLHPELFDHAERLVNETDQLFDFPLVRYVRRVEESRLLNTSSGAAVIIAASGMAESGRILHHLMHHGGRKQNLILFVGFQAEHTLGRRIQEGQRVVKIFGEEVEIAAEVETLGGYSAHADRAELRRWVESIGGPIQRGFVVHGERAPAAALAETLRQVGVKEVIIPRRGDRFEL